MGLHRYLPIITLFVSACGTSIVPQGGVQTPSATFTPSTRGQPSGVMGADARSLQRLLGTPRLDIRDPAARKLQFANAQCVLDAYLYPPSANREPTVAHVDARSSAGEDMDWGVCASLLRRR